MNIRDRFKNKPLPNPDTLFVGDDILTLIAAVKKPLKEAHAKNRADNNIKLNLNSYCICGEDALGKLPACSALEELVHRHRVMLNLLRRAYEKEQSNG